MPTGTGPIRVLIADDHPVVRGGLKLLLDSEPGLEVAGESVDGVQVVRMAAEVGHDVILMDLLSAVRVLSPRASGRPGPVTHGKETE